MAIVGQKNSRLEGAATNSRFVLAMAIAEKAAAPPRHAGPASLGDAEKVMLARGVRGQRTEVRCQMSDVRC